MAKNDGYAGQLIDEIKALKEENEKLKENCEIVRRNLAKSREDYKERTTEVLKLERRIQKLAENPYNSYALRLIKEIEQLNEQIAMMKCCENCYYRNYIEEDDEYGCGLYWSGNPNTDECVYDHSCKDRTNAVDRWKLKE